MLPQVVPGASTIYARLALRRMVFDQIQILGDPEYRESFRRQEQRAARDYGQSFWWRPGHALPGH